MFKRVTLVIVSMLVLTSATMADDDLLNELANSKGTNIADASIEVEDFNLDVDVDALAENAGSDEDAVEACFRRFGYRRWGCYGYSYGYRCFRPVYNCYTVYRPYFCRPIYHHYYRPFVSYWGCY